MVPRRCSRPAATRSLTLPGPRPPVPRRPPGRVPRPRPEPGRVPRRRPEPGGIPRPQPGRASARVPVSASALVPASSLNLYSRSRSTVLESSPRSSRPPRWSAHAVPSSSGAPLPAAPAGPRPSAPRRAASMGSAPCYRRSARPPWPLPDRRPLRRPGTCSVPWPRPERWASSTSSRRPALCALGGEPRSHAGRSWWQHGCGWTRGKMSATTWPVRTELPARPPTMPAPRTRESAGPGRAGREMPTSHSARRWQRGPTR
jgi:hypothetical protein